MRWLLVKDLQILRRSPLLVGLLVVYPIALALMIGFALSSPPGKPKVAFVTEVKKGTGVVRFGDQKVDVSRYANELFKAIDPVPAKSREDAIAKVRSGQAAAALIVPADLPRQLEAIVTTGMGRPTVELVLNVRDPLERRFVDATVKAVVSDVEQAVSKQVLKVALNDLRQVLNGGSLDLLGTQFRLLGLRGSRTLLQATDAALPPRSPLRPGLQEIIHFADLAIEGLGFAGPVLGSIGDPLTIDRTELAGRTTPADAYAVAIAVIVSLMFVTLLLAAGMLALEREEHVFGRLVRGLVSRSSLLAEKVALSALCAGATSLLMVIGISAFVSLHWSRFPLWLLALAAAALAFGALGVAIGGLTGEVRAASLLAFLLSLPIAFVALIPADAVSSGLKTVLDVVSACFPFKPSLQAADRALNGAAGGLLGPLAHLAVLTLAFGALARLSLRRFD